jgi:hypothetical protein
LPGTTLAATPLPTHALLAHTTTESSASHSCPALKEEYGTTPFPSVSAPPQVSTTARNVSTVLPDNSMPMEDASAPRVLSTMVLNASIRPSIDVSVFQTLTGMEPTASVTQDSKATVTHVFVTVSLWEIIVRDAPLSPTLSLRTVSANVTLDTSSLKANVF